MTDAGNVFSLHGVEIDAATEADREWFSRNPGRRYRVRDAVAFEFNQRMPEPPAGTTWRVLVAQVQEGMRLRLPIYVPRGARNEDATEADLAHIFEQMADERFKKLMRSGLSGSASAPKPAK